MPSAGGVEGGCILPARLPVPQTVNLFGNRVIAEVVSEGAVMLEKGGPSSRLTGVFGKRWPCVKHRHMGRTPHDTKAGMAVVQM